MKRILLAIMSVAGVAAVAILGTSAFFSDTETSTDNSFVAGDLDLTLSSTAHYAGMECTEVAPGVYEWQDEDGDVNNNPRPELLNTFCDGTWTAEDFLGNPFVNLVDVKPGDAGENTIGLNVTSNPAWACVQFGNATSDDNGLTEPEESDGDTTPGLGEGELDQEIYVVAWDDDGDNIWQSGEDWLIDPNTPMSLQDLAIGGALPLFEPGGDVMQPDTDYFIGAYWCHGQVDFDGSSLSCDGTSATNISQTDSVFGDVAFYVEQARNNDSFSCDNVDLFPPETTVGAALGGYSIPDAQTCDVTVEDGDDLQTEIDNASSGDLVCIDDGTYNEFVVNKPLTIAGLVNPETSATIVPSGPGVTELAYVISSDVSITGLHFDGTGTTFTGSQLAGIQVSPSGANIDNVNITYNLIENLDVSNSNAANKGIQWHDGASSGSPNVVYSLTNSDFSHNVIRNITSANKGGYGIQTVGDMDGVTMTYNTISDIDGAWGAGIAVDGHEPESTTGVVIAYNQLVDNLWSDVSVQVEHNADQTGVAVNYNNLEFLVHGSGSPASLPELNAENNWWGDTDPSDDFTGPVDYDPYASSAYALN